MIESLKLPFLNIKTELEGEFDYIHFFVITQKNFHVEFPNLIIHLSQIVCLWVSWPKSGKENTDLNIKSIIKIGYEYGLVVLMLSLSYSAC